ncbi:unnamed protein product [Durusdinium trenchii]|uniref:Uncharacterized protein n=3 Tax=Durusdinium trenchii TaxID=1381693 RepID=A0ABP0K9V3_9DINO
MASQARQRKGKVPNNPPEIDVDLPESASVARIAAGQPTPRSTLGSPLTSHATYKRSGVGDLGAGPRRHISLSQVELLPWLCCMAPAIFLFATYAFVFFSVIFSTFLAELVTALLTLITWLWISNLSLASFAGVFKMRQAAAIDWHAKLHEMPLDARAGLKHIVLLPNYMEAEKMLKETLDNLARSRLAKSCVHIVLAMEAREGPAGREKAERIMAEKKHLFADIFATYHPQNLPGEVAGKSSNTQWAFREALRRYGASLSKRDLSRVFLTVADADTLLHPQYLSALTYQGLLMDKEERSWTIWQPPVLLVRNIFSVPALTRTSSHAALIFELATLASQHIFPAFAYSSYSMTLALASHPEVDGWDVDVIAEDHHMYCKCYFAALWELSHAKKEHEKQVGDGNEIQLVPQVKVQAVFCPAVSYLVESTEGYTASLFARFQQARRHTQGIVELGYVFLQWFRLSSSIGFMKVPWRTHFSISMIAAKMHTIHVIAVAQCFALILLSLTQLLPRAGRFAYWIWHGGFSELFQELSSSWSGMNGAEQALLAAISQISGIMLLYALTCAMVVADMVEGTYYTNADSKAPITSAMHINPVAERQEEDEPETPKEQGPPSRLEMPGLPEGRRSWLWRTGLFLYVYADTMLSGYPACCCWGMVPGMLAGWSLLRRGTDFEYIVAMKPE